jgi:YfiH family protein
VTSVQRVNGIDVIRSATLSAKGLVFGMSTRHGGVSPLPLDLNLSFSVGDDPANVEKNRKVFFDTMEIPLDRLAFPTQVHGAGVTRIDRPGRFDACDALLTNTRGIYVCISVADCVPVFLYDPTHEVIAGVHAGWRGTVEGIAAASLARMSLEFNTEPRDVVAFIGPSAGGCCYAVGPDVANLFDAKFCHVNNGSTTIDLKQANREQLLTAGVGEESIEVSPLCTITESHLLHSYRRDGPRSGRMLAVCGMRQVKR